MEIKNLTLFYFRGNTRKIDLSVSPKSVLSFKARISGKKTYLTSFWFCEKS